jgi:hypothetical protein
MYGIVLVDWTKTKFRFFQFSFLEMRVAFQKNSIKMITTKTTTTKQRKQKTKKI